MQKPEELPEIKKKPTDYENIKLSRDEYEVKNRKRKELAARLAIESDRIQKELEIEGENDLGAVSTEDSDEVQTVRTKGRPRKNKQENKEEV